jgi:hypothetical protein
MTKFVYMIIAAFMLACLSCGDGGTGPADTTLTVSGTLTCSLAADGVPAYGSIVTGDPDSIMTSVYPITVAPFAGGVSSYSVSDVEEGSYYLGVFIDMNENYDPEDSTAGPDDGDLLALLPLVVNGNEVLNVLEDDWDMCGGGGNICVSGNLNKNGVADGISGYAGLLDSNFTFQYMSVTAFDGGSTHYNIYDVEEDSYLFGAFIDINGNANTEDPEPDEGDWLIDPYSVWIDQNTEIDVNEADWSLYHN